MEKLEWCLRAKNGIVIIGPNENLSKAYIKKAEDSLEAAVMLKQNKEWGISTSYYTMYFALYSILMRIGIKCEIHACTIECMSSILSEYFTQEEYKFLRDSQTARIDSQYYVDRTVSEKQYQEMLKKAPLFMVRCKETLLKLNDNEITRIRNKIKNI